MSFKDLTNKKFHKLLVLKRVENKGKKSQWLCLCDCGKEKIILGNSLTTGNTKSCGYFREKYEETARENITNLLEILKM